MSVAITSPFVSGAKWPALWDMKPKAPAEVRGEFRPIATAVPGLWACEHLPHLARVADRLTIIRSLQHGLTNHLPAAFTTLIGRDPPGRGVRLLEVSLLFETREDAADGGRGQTQAGGSDQQG